MVGKALTVADFALVASASKREPAGLDLSGYSNLRRYFSRIESTVFSSPRREALKHG